MVVGTRTARMIKTLIDIGSDLKDENRDVVDKRDVRDDAKAKGGRTIDRCCRKKVGRGTRCRR